MNRYENALRVASMILNEDADAQIANLQKQIADLKKQVAPTEDRIAQLQDSIKPKLLRIAQLQEQLLKLKPGQKPNAF